jgi:hypothetical protein
MHLEDKLAIYIYSNLRPSTNRKHFRAFVYVWNGAFTVGNWNVSPLMWHVTLKSLKLFLAQMSCFDVPPCTFQYFQAHKSIIIRSSHKKYEYKQVWSLLQYRELGNTETYTKAHQKMKNNWIGPVNYNTSHEQWNIPFPTVNVTFQT